MPRRKSGKRSTSRNNASKLQRAKGAALHPAAADAAPETKPQTLQETYKALEKVLALYSPPAKMWMEGSNSKPSTRLTVPNPVVVPGHTAESRSTWSSRR